jgi:hypothetical protein
MSYWKTTGYRINYYMRIAGRLTAIKFEHRMRDSDATLGALLTELARSSETGATIDATRELVGGDSPAHSVVPIAHFGPADEIRATGSHMKAIGFDLRNPLEGTRPDPFYTHATYDETSEFLVKQGFGPFAIGIDVYWIDDAGTIATVEPRDTFAKYADLTFHVRSEGSDVRSTVAGSCGIVR